MSSTCTPRERSTSVSASPQSSPTGPTGRVSAKTGEGLDGVEGDGSDHGERHGGKRVASAPVRAILIREWGGPDVLELVEDAPVPEPSDDQVLVRVSRAGI